MTSDLLQLNEFWIISRIELRIEKSKSKETGLSYALKRANQSKRDKPIKPGNWIIELGYQSSLECMLADIGIKLISYQLDAELSSLESN